MKYSLGDFTFFKNIRGPLNQSDLEFFYYCVANEHDNSLLSAIDWQLDIRPMLNIENVDIKFIENDSTNTASINNINWHAMAIDKVVLTKDVTETEVVSFFRHLRNAFSHFHIYHFGNEYYFSDNVGAKLTMKGRIKSDKLKNLVFHTLKLVEQKTVKL